MTWLHAIPFPNINPVFLELGPLQFRWYGLMYLIGLTSAYFLIKRRVESRGLSMTKNQVYDMIVWAAFGGRVGERAEPTFFEQLQNCKKSRLQDKLSPCYDEPVSKHILPF